MSETAAQLAITIAVENSELVFTVNVPANLSVELFLKNVVAPQINAPLNRIQLLHNGAVLANHAQTLEQVGVTAQDFVVARLVAPPVASAARSATVASTNNGGSGGGPINAALLGQQLAAAMQNVRAAPPTARQEAETFRSQMMADANRLAVLAHNDPRLASAVRNNDIDTLEKAVEANRRVQAERSAELQRLHANPLDPANQRRMEELIRQEQVRENYENALEYNPAAFARVTMLYIDCKVNGRPLKAFVDSGAQQTIMSQRIAQQCGIMHLIDKRFSGIAKGVGTSKIIGRVHLAPIEIGGSTFNCTFTILENDDMDFLFGLDMLKAHQACIDLKANVLRIGSDIAVPFLAEKDIPKSFADGGGSGGDDESSAMEEDRVQPSSSTSSSSFPETSVKALTDLGIPRQQAIALLQATGGNVQLAAQMIG